MSKNNKKNFGAKIINFSNTYEPPTYSANRYLKLYKWGDDNLFPNFLLELYNNKGGSRHKAIIDKKVRMMVGNGFEDIKDVKLKNFVFDNNLKQEIIKIAYDYEIFNGFAFEVVWSRDRKSLPIIKHMPISQVRNGILEEDNFEYFWVSSDWSNTRSNKPEAYLAFNEDVKEGRQIYYYSEYNPANVTTNYPIPVYNAAINSIMTDYELSKYDLNNVSRGFFPSFNLNFASGIPSEEEQDEFYKSFERNFMGPENTGSVFITYTDPSEGDEPPTLKKIELNDSDERFLSIAERSENEVVQGSGMPPQLLIQTAGKLGSTGERKELMKEFYQSYIQPRQETIEQILNRLLSVNGFNEELILERYNFEEDDNKNNVKEDEN